MVEGVGPPQPPGDVAGERRGPHDHPRITPDGNGQRAPRGRKGSRPQPGRHLDPFGDGPPQGLREQTLERGERLWNGLDVRDPHPNAGIAEPAYVELTILLLVRDHDVRSEPANRGKVRVLGAADA